MNGIYLPSKQKDMILSGAKSLIVTKDKITEFDSQSLLLLSASNICARVRVESPREIKKSEFDSLYDLHKIDSASCEKWWGNREVLYGYKVTVEKVFDTDLRWAYKNVKSLFVKDVPVIATDSILDMMEGKKFVVEQPKQDDASMKTIEKFKQRFALQAEYYNILPDHKDKGFYDMMVIKGKPTYNLRIQEDETTVNVWEMQIEDISRFEKVQMKYKGNQSLIFMKTSEKKVFLTKMKELYLKFFTLDSGECEFSKLSEKAYQIICKGQFMKGQYVISRRAETDPWVMEKVI